MTALFSDALADVPVVAVLRGLAPSRAAGVAVRSCAPVFASWK
jgi:hypothetical protein